MEYKVVWAESIENIERKVNKLITEGWRISGELHITNRSSFTDFTQVMIKKNKGE